MKTDEGKVLEKELTLEKSAVQEQPVQDERYKYKREDCETGYLTDPIEIEEFIRHQRIDIYQNALLGDYGVDGTYALPDEITDELLKAHKVITNNYENFIFAQTVRPIGEYGVAKFFITVTELGEGLLATLTLVEPVHKMNKLVTNAQSAQIASYADKRGQEFYFKMKQEFNIVDDDYVVPQDADKFIYALRRKNQRAEVWKKSLKEIERTEQEIFEKRIEVLEKLDSDYSKEVLARFNGERSKKEPFFKKSPNHYTCMNQLLDECISIVAGRFPQQEVLAFKKMMDATLDIVEEQKKIIVATRGEVAREHAKTAPGPRVYSEPPAPKREPAKQAQKVKENVKQEPITSFMPHNESTDVKKSLGNADKVADEINKTDAQSQKVSNAFNDAVKGLTSGNTRQRTQAVPKPKVNQGPEMSM